MNDEGRLHSAPATSASPAAHDTKARGVCRLPVELTPLQQQLHGLVDLLADTRDVLDDDAYPVFVQIACDRIGLEAARLLFGELLRGSLDDEIEAA